MKKFKVTIKADIIVEFDQNSEEFQTLWANYLEHFDPSSDYETLAENIAHYVAKYGTDSMYEGIGFLKLNGKNQNIFYNGKYEEQKGYVNIQCDTDINKVVDFEIDYTEDLSTEDME